MPDTIYTHHKYYVYVYIDPRTWLPFYYGKGCGDRLHDHLRETLETTINKRKFYRIRKLKRLSLEPILFKHKEGMNEDDAKALEIQMILFWGRKDYDPGGILLNIVIDGNPPNMKGYKHSKETKQKMSKASKSRTHSKETKEKMSVSQTGKICSEASKQKMSDSHKGAKHHMFGKHFSEEHKRKIAAANLGKRRSKETKQKIHIALKIRYKDITNHPHFGKPRSKETKEKISNTLKGKYKGVNNPNFGKHLSKERKQKMSIVSSKPYAFVSPEGILHEGNNTKEFAKKHNLSSGTLASVKSGKRLHHKGWTAKKTTHLGEWSMDSEIDSAFLIPKRV